VVSAALPKGSAMTLRGNLLHTLRQAGPTLGEAASRVQQFLQAQRHPEGGFRGRGSDADLYYTAFGLEASLALGALPDDVSLHRYLNAVGDGSDLDLVHLASLARCWATLAEIRQAGLNPRLQRDLSGHLAQARCPDGGFNTGHARTFGNAQGALLALGAYQDLGLALPDRDQLVGSIRSLRRDNGAFTHERGTGPCSTSATAAALCVLHYLQAPLPEQSVTWLLAQAHPQGGFPAAAHTGTGAMPDLLSTATALFALDRAAVNLEALREINLHFCDTLWQPEGGFAGHVLDPTLDCEYTYYGLLALGVLSPPAAD
jgi:prenyltransferase beta subunit